MAANPTFQATLAGHVYRYVDFGLQDPCWYAVGLPLAIAECHLPAPRGLLDVVAGSICYFCALDAIDDVEDEDLERWRGLPPPEILNLGVALQFAAIKAFQVAGCSASFFAKLSDLALETAAGQALDLASTPARLQDFCEDDYLRLNALKTGSTLELIARATCDLLGFSPVQTDACATWARSLGVYVQTAGDNDDAARDFSGDVARGKVNLALLHLWSNLEASERQDLLDGLGRYRSDPDQPRRLKAQFAAAGSLAHAAARRRQLATSLDRALDSLVAPQHRQGFQLLILGHEPLEREDGPEGGLPAGGPASVPACWEDRPLEAAPRDAGASSGDRLRERLGEATGALLEDPLFRESWDVHRCGFKGHAHLVGDVFPIGLVADVLLGCGSDDPIWWEHLERRRGPHGWVYFPEMPELPPDCDVLGQMLQVAARLAERGRQKPDLDGPLQVLLDNRAPDGSVPTWLATPGQDGAAVSAAWHGNDCLAAMANAYYGLLQFDSPRYATLVAASLPIFLERFKEEGDWRSFWYRPMYARHVAVRLLSAASKAVALPAAQQEALDGCLASTRQLIRAELDCAGAWGTPQGTALAISTLVLLGDRAADLEGAVAYLLATQGVDGLWPAEPLYLTPARGEGFVWYGSKTVTTAFCLRALGDLLEL